MQAVGILRRIDGFEHREFVEALRQRQLNDVAGARRVGVQLRDRVEHLRLCRGRGQIPPYGRDAQLRAVAVLAGDVRTGSRVVADENRAETGHHAAIG